MPKRKGKRQRFSAFTAQCNTNNMNLKLSHLPISRYRMVCSGWPFKFHPKKKKQCTVRPNIIYLHFSVPLDLIQFKFQNESKAVFEARPITTKATVTSLLVFALAFGLDFTFHSSHISPLE